MKCLRRNLKKIKYSNYLGKSSIVDSNGYETGDYSNSYSTPTTIECNISPAKGAVINEQFGNDISYDRILVSDNVGWDISESSVVFIDVEPNDARSNFDYIVKRVASSLNVVSVAIQRVDAK